LGGVCCDSNSAESSGGVWTGFFGRSEGILSMMDIEVDDLAWLVSVY
jgi:hypothetical protein